MYLFSRGCYQSVNTTKKDVGANEEPQKHNNLHCMKSVQIRSFFWSVFSRIQTDTRIQSAYGEIQTRKNSKGLGFIVLSEKNVV